MNELDEKTVNITTKCKDCIFSVITYEKPEPKQSFCRISAINDNRLYTFIDRNLAELDVETGYYVIKTICNTFRKSHTESIMSDEEEAIFNSTIQVDAILIDYVNPNIENLLMDTIHIINNQKVKPKMFILVSKNYNKPYQQMYDLVEDHCDVPFKLVSVKDTNASLRDCIDIAVSKCNNTYYLLMMPGESLSESYIYKLDRRINWELKPFSMVSTNAIHGFVLQTQLHRLLGGNKEMWIEDKIQELAQNQDLQKMIISYDELA